MSGVLDFFLLFSQAFRTPKPFVVGRDLSRNKNLEMYVFEFPDFQKFSVSLINLYRGVSENEGDFTYGYFRSTVPRRTTPGDFLIIVGYRRIR